MGEAEGRSGDVLDQIELLFSCEQKSRRQIGTKLRDLGLIRSVKDISSKPIQSSRQWTEDEIEKLKELLAEYKYDYKDMVQHVNVYYK